MAQAGPAEVGVEQPSLIEHRAIELGADQFGLVELGGAKDGAGEIEPGKIEPGQFLAGEIGRMAGRCSLGHGGDLGARHLRRGHLRRIQVEITHHVLRARRQSEDKPTERQRSD